jgi:hypothetical protein
MIMDKNALLEMAGNPNFIPGIYNYCDRWCERCAFTRRCMVFAAEQKESPHQEHLDMRNREFWDGMDAQFKLTMELVHDLAKERGIDLNAVDQEAVREQHWEKRRRAKRHPLAREAIQYSRMVTEWLGLQENIFKKKGEALEREHELGIAEPEVTAAELIHAIEVIRWYQHQIAVKLMRALGGEEPAEEMEELPLDTDGSAKVALIGIDRSIGAWGNLLRHLPDELNGIINILVHLGRLRGAIEERFPHARRFVRPGFDQER